jgi:hypothetical protein
VRDAAGNLFANVTGIALGDRGIFCRREIFGAAASRIWICPFKSSFVYRSCHACFAGASDDLLRLKFFNIAISPTMSASA